VLCSWWRYKRNTESFDQVDLYWTLGVPPVPFYRFVGHLLYFFSVAACEQLKAFLFFYVSDEGKSIAGGVPKSGSCGEGGRSGWN